MHVLNNDRTFNYQQPKMGIQKLIAFLKKESFLSCSLDVQKPNQTVLWRQTSNTFILFIYIYIYILSISSLFSSYLILFLLIFFSLSAMVRQFPCGICSKTVANNYQAIKCDKYNLWIHIKCNKINKQTYNYLKSDSSHWFCISCTKEFLPFSGIEDGKFAHATLGKKIKFTHVSNTPKSIRENFIQAIHSENNSSWYFTRNDLTVISYEKRTVSLCSIWT